MRVRLADLELLELHALGGMAEVYRARLVDGARTTTVAVKKMLPQYLDSADIREMFVEEARVAALLLHENLVRVYDLVSTPEGELYLVMEFASGRDLADLLWLAGRRGERLSLPAVLRIARDALRGIGHAHNAVDGDGRPLGLVHRDVSPHNVLVTASGVVKVTDFGIAKVATTARKTAAGIIKGKLGYMSPEQARGQRLDARSDLYNVGILLYEMLAGARLFEGRTDLDVISRMREGHVPPLDRGLAVPPAVEELVRQSLALKPDARPQTAEAFARAIDDVAAGVGIALAQVDLAAALRHDLAPVALHAPAPPEPPPSARRPDAALAAADASEQPRFATHADLEVSSVLYADPASDERAGAAAEAKAPAQARGVRAVLLSHDAAPAPPRRAVPLDAAPAPRAAAIPQGSQRAVPVPDGVVRRAAENPSAEPAPRPPPPPPAALAATAGASEPAAPRPPPPPALLEAARVDTGASAARDDARAAEGVVLADGAEPARGAVPSAAGERSARPVGSRAPIGRRPARTAVPRAVRAFAFGIGALIALAVGGTARGLALARQHVLLVESVPAGAQVTIDGGGPFGATPLLLRTSLAPGVHDVAFQSAAGTQHRTLAVTSTDRGSVVRAQLNAPGQLRIASRPRGARVVVDGIDVGATPLVVDVDPAHPHALTMRLEGYADFTRELPLGVSVPPLHAVLQPLDVAGRAVIDSTPRARLIVDGIEIGTTSPEPRECLLGSHEVTLVRDDGRRFERRITVRPGLTNSTFFNIEDE